jgi:flagellar assembly protein FliH
MNLPSEANLSQASYRVAASGIGTLNAFLVPERSVAPFEFRSLTSEAVDEMTQLAESKDGRSVSSRAGSYRPPGRNLTKSSAERATESVLRDAVATARQEGVQQGRLEARREARSELEAEMVLSVALERKGLTESLDQFRGVRDRYFAEVEQEIVRLALAIAARVLHREAQIDPLLLTGVVRVALEKMADRTGVVLRVAGADVDAWDVVFRATKASERPKVVEDSRLERGECVLETKMGTVELGVRVQLEEIEKGFFDLLNHRPVE